MRLSPWISTPCSWSAALLSCLTCGNLAIAQQARQFPQGTQVAVQYPRSPQNAPATNAAGQAYQFQGQVGQGQAGQVPGAQVQQAQVQQQAQLQQQAQGQPAQGQELPGQSRPVRAQLTPAQMQQVQATQQQALAEGAVNPVAPFPPLNDKWKAYLDQVLAKWELESGKVEKFECEFLRYQYDPTLADKDAYTIARGALKYMKPDKGLFKVNELVYFSGRDQASKPQYQVNPKKPFGEYWICDGQYVHVWDQNEKKCTKYQLPPQMRGNAIHLSPLPFVFGVKKEELEGRYWINPLPLPENRQNEVWLEVFPRRADDAANYLKLQVVLDLKDWMPKGLIVFLPNWRANAEHRELYQFDKRIVNATNILPQLFQKEFIPADPPKDWQVIIEPYQAEPAAPPTSEPRVASPPSTTIPR